ncbi:MAG: DUF6868 family protein [Pseudomonadota bacterium]
MSDLAQLTEFLGWTLVVNSVVLLFATLALAAGRSFIVPIHSKLLALDETQLNQLYASYLSIFKVAVLVLSLSPYIALKIMGF